MAIYHASAKVVKRSAGRSATAAAAYRAGEVIVDDATGEVFDYTMKDHVDHKEIITPSDAPEWASDRSKLWNEVERSEKRINSQVAREFEIAIPKELTTDQAKNLVTSFVKDQFVDRGMVADVCCHNLEKENPHAHILLTMRDIGPEGFSARKNREWNKKEQLLQCRESWGEYANKALLDAGSNERIDHRSHEDRGINLIPTVKLGTVAHSMEKKGIRTERGDTNRKIEALNSELIQVQTEINQINQDQHYLWDLLQNPEKLQELTLMNGEEFDQSIEIREIVRRIERDLEGSKRRLSETKPNPDKLRLDAEEAHGVAPLRDKAAEDKAKLNALDRAYEARSFIGKHLAPSGWKLREQFNQALDSAKSSHKALREAIEEKREIIQDYIKNASQEQTEASTQRYEQVLQELSQLEKFKEENPEAWPKPPEPTPDQAPTPPPVQPQRKPSEQSAISKSKTPTLRM